MAQGSCHRHLQSPNEVDLRIFQVLTIWNQERRALGPHLPFLMEFHFSLHSAHSVFKRKTNYGVRTVHMTNHLWRTPVGPVSCSWAPVLYRINSATTEEWEESRGLTLFRIYQIIHWSRWSVTNCNTSVLLFPSLYLRDASDFLNRKTLLQMKREKWCEWPQKSYGIVQFNQSISSSEMKQEREPCSLWSDSIVTVTDQLNTLSQIQNHFLNICRSQWLSPEQTTGYSITKSQSLKQRNEVCGVPFLIFWTRALEVKCHCELNGYSTVLRKPVADKYFKVTYATWGS